jgi:hypothetical protein
VRGDFGGLSMSFHDPMLWLLAAVTLLTVSHICTIIRLNHLEKKVNQKEEVIS